jgi:hypothetical protein
MRKGFPMRMAEYLLGIGLCYGQIPRQVVLYVGEAPLRMSDGAEGRDFSVRFHLVDIRDLDGERLLASTHVGDKVLAVLTRWSEQPKAVVRKTEPNFRIVECFDLKENTCRILPVCSLRGVLVTALESFFAALASTRSPIWFA